MKELQPGDLVKITFRKKWITYVVIVPYRKGELGFKSLLAGKKGKASHIDKLRPYQHERVCDLKSQQGAAISFHQWRASFVCYRILIAFDKGGPVYKSISYVLETQEQVRQRRNLRRLKERVLERDKRPTRRKLILDGVFRRLQQRGQL